MVRVEVRGRISGAGGAEEGMEIHGGVKIHSGVKSHSRTVVSNSVLAN